MSSLVEMNPKIHVTSSGGGGRRRGFNSWEVRYYFVPVCKNDLLDPFPETIEVEFLNLALNYLYAFKNHVNFLYNEVM